MLCTYHHPQFPPEVSSVQIWLYKDVKNASNLRTKIVHASTAVGEQGDAEREAVNFAFIDARLITSLDVLKAAIYHSILAHEQGTLRTKTVHSEILWTLNASNNITEALRRYGVSDATSSLFVVRVDTPQLPDMTSPLQQLVDGTLVPIVELGSLVDWSAIKKYHKLNSEPAFKSVKDPTTEHAMINKYLISFVASKSVAS